MNKQKKALLLLTILCLFQSPVTAMLPQGHKDVPRNRVLIINGTSVSVKFWLRNNNSERWYAFQLDPGEDDIYKHSEQIWIGTDEQRSVFYGLKGGKRYKIVWNGQEGKYDLIVITKLS